MQSLPFRVCFSCVLNHLLSLSHFQVCVMDLSWLSLRSPVTWSRCGTGRWCWTAGWKARVPSRWRGIRTERRCFRESAAGRRSYPTARSWSAASRRDGMEIRPMLESITARHRTTTACWSAARPECSSHVSDWGETWPANEIIHYDMKSYALPILLIVYVSNTVT